MSAILTPSHASLDDHGRAFIPGTLGWTASDLEDPTFARLWFAGRYEIIEGVLTTMPAAYMRGGRALFKLLYHVTTELEKRGITGSFGTEVDMTLAERRVVVADAVFMTPEDDARQANACSASKKSDPDRTRLLVPPTLVIESVSEGHEAHDNETKLRFYAEFGVPHYWILDSAARSLKCLVLDGNQYRIDVEGTGDADVTASLFSSLLIPLSRLWV